MLRHCTLDMRRQRCKAPPLRSRIAHKYIHNESLSYSPMSMTGAMTA